MPECSVQQLDAHELTAQIRQRARQIGFDLVGIAPATPSMYRDYLRDWLDDGQAGSMQYLHNRFAERTDPSAYVTGARSVICVAINYHVELEPIVEDDRQHHGRIARYALGDDYHETIKSKLHELADWVKTRAPGAQTRCSVDTAPVMEKELAARAGVGWIGKNTCLINEQIGSWLLLGEVITTLELPIDQPAIDRCGTCRRCIDACPTGAITEPYKLDARRCISYLTIEHRDDIPTEFHPAIGEWLYGCDICQDVCPWNSKAPIAMDASLQPRFATGTIDLRRVQEWSQEDYRSSLRGSAMKRVKLPQLQRNARIVQANLKGKDRCKTLDEELVSDR
ncbi:MAG: tRNA epoxyqueuosine(34) reductase QueG [Anaerolineae bacterium]|nr:tRNA epoxyqueuosine(34) reductase QueG [Phycisphaerae bacterium]